jgi:hypothetical protein
LKAKPINALTLLALILLTLARPATAQGRLEISGTIDWTDKIVIRQDAATWQHLFGNLEVTQVRINGVLWQPSQNATLPNSGATRFLTNQVNFLAARMQLLEGRDTVVLQREHDQLTLSFADTPNGPSTYSLVITFPETPTLLVEADIDGSDELHISYAGARWLHKQWSFPANVRLNGIPWNPAANPFLLNHGATTFLPESVSFENAVVLEQSARDLLTVRPVSDGLIINFADGFLGAAPFSALIAFPENESLPNNLIPVVTAAQIQMTTNAAISIQTVRGVWYELQSTENLTANWIATGAYLQGNGTPMTLFDPVSTPSTKFYRIVSKTQP